MSDSAAFLSCAAECYGFSPAQAVPLTGGHFSKIYEFPGYGKTFVLRVTPPNAEIDVPAMRAVLNWLSYLAEQGGSVPTPLCSRWGNLIESVQLDDGLYVLVAFEKVDGTLAEDLFPEHWSDDLTSALGNAVGRMHAISRTYRPWDTSLLRPAWDEIGNCFNPAEELDAAHALVSQKLREIRSNVRTLPKDEISYGLIHTDLHFANFIVDAPAHRATIIDFDDCSYGWYAMDLAMLVLDLTVLYTTPGREAYTQNFLKQFLHSYLQHHLLDLDWIRKLPYFLKLLEIGLYEMLYQQYDPTDTQSWVGRFMLGRRSRIENDIPYIGLDFSSLADEIGRKASLSGKSSRSYAGQEKK
jgi:amicoumacin kinase